MQIPNIGAMRTAVEQKTYLNRLNFLKNQFTLMGMTRRLSFWKSVKKYASFLVRPRFPSMDYPSKPHLAIGFLNILLPSSGK